MVAEEKPGIINKDVINTAKAFKSALPYIILFNENVKNVLGSSHTKEAMARFDSMIKSIDVKQLERMKNFVTMPVLESEKTIPYIPIIPHAITIAKAQRERDEKMIEILEDIKHNTSVMLYTKLTVDEIDSFCEAICYATIIITG